MNITAPSKELLTIFIPTSVVTQVEPLTSAITGIVGGTTITHTWGEWLDDDGHVVGESVAKYEWLATNTAELHEQVVALAEAMLNLGEQCVLVTFTGRFGISSVMYSKD